MRARKTIRIELDRNMWKRIPQRGANGAEDSEVVVARVITGRNNVMQLTFKCAYNGVE